MGTKYFERVKISHLNSNENTDFQESFEIVFEQ